MTGRPSRSESARLLRQRAELGPGEELFLADLTREEAIELARRAAASGASDTGGPGRAASSAGPGNAPTGTPAPSDAVDAPKAGHRDRSATPVTGALPAELPATHDGLQELALACQRCRLADGRKNVVFSDGSPEARLMVVGEAPGANEDATGLPFVGAAGRYLDLLLATVDLSRKESVYICNVLKCRPPGNRDPMPDEIDLCSPFLRQQIEIVRPEAMLAVGSFSAKLLTGREKSALGKLRGEVHNYQGVPLIVTYHPAALLRNPRWTRAFWDDLQLLRTVMDGAAVR